MDLGKGFPCRDILEKMDENSMTHWPLILKSKKPIPAFFPLLNGLEVVNDLIQLDKNLFILCFFEGFITVLVPF